MRVHNSISPPLGVHGLFLSLIFIKGGCKKSDPFRSLGPVEVPTTFLRRRGWVAAALALMGAIHLPARNLFAMSRLLRG